MEGIEGKAIIKLDKEAVKNLLENSGIDLKALMEPYLASIIKEKIEEHMNRWIRNNLEYNCSQLFRNKIENTITIIANKVIKGYEKDNKKLEDLIDEYWNKTKQSIEKQLAEKNLIEEHYLIKLIKQEVINFFKNK